MKLCKDCDHYRIVRGEFHTFRMCHHQRNATVSNDNIAKSCDLSRKEGPCGPEGVLWEPIRPQERLPFWRRLFSLSLHDDNGRRF